MLLPDTKLLESISGNLYTSVFVKFLFVTIRYPASQEQIVYLHVEYQLNEVVAKLKLLLIFGTSSIRGNPGSSIFLSQSFQGFSIDYLLSIHSGNFRKFFLFPAPLFPYYSPRVNLFFMWAVDGHYWKVTQFFFRTINHLFRRA